MGTDREINNLLNEFLQLETDEQRRQFQGKIAHTLSCLLYTSPSPRDCS